jgi:hypothetical protein
MQALKLRELMSDEFNRGSVIKKNYGELEKLAQCP